MAHFVEVYIQFWSCFKVWLKQNFFDTKDFNCNYNPIYSTFFRWLLQFLPLTTIEKEGLQARKTIIYFNLCSQTFLCLLCTAITSSRCSVPAFRQSGKFDFFDWICPKNGFRFGISENKCQNKNQNPQETLWANFRAKWMNLTFSAQICPKMDLGLDI